MKYLDFVITQRGALNMEIGDVSIKKGEYNALEQFKILLEDWIPKDASIAIAVDASYIFYSPSIHHVRHTFSEEVKPNSVAAQVLKTRKKTPIVTDDSIFGTPYSVIGYPILIEHQPAALIIIFPSLYASEKGEQFKFLTGKHGEDWIPIPIEQVSHIESLQKRTWFYANNKQQYSIKITLKELHSKLPENFLRIHRSYIINTYFIKRLTKDLGANVVVELKNGLSLPVSQTHVAHLREYLGF